MVANQLTGQFEDFTRFVDIPRAFRAELDAKTLAGVQLWLRWPPPTSFPSSGDRIVCASRQLAIWVTMVVRPRAGMAARLPRLPEELWLYMFGLLKHGQTPVYWTETVECGDDDDGSSSSSSEGGGTWKNTLGRTMKRTMERMGMKVCLMLMNVQRKRKSVGCTCLAGGRRSTLAMRSTSTSPPFPRTAPLALSRGDSPGGFFYCLLMTY